LKVKQLDELPDELKSHDSVTELRRLMQIMGDSGVTNGVFDVSIMRGFDYYTDIVFEVNDTDPENNRAMFGGGRYDGLVGLFGVEPVPTVGFGMGDVTIANFLETHNLKPVLVSETSVYMVLVGDVYERVQPLVSELRGRGLNVAVDMTGRKPGDQIKNATKKSIEHVLFVGDKELSENRYNLKNIVTGDEQNLDVDGIVIALSGRK